MKEQMIEDILENFDFENVSKVMKFLDWKWGLNEKAEIPSIYQLIKAATRLLNNAYDDVLQYGCEYLRTGSGGFYATATHENGNVVCLSLDFVLESWDVDVDLDDLEEE